MVVTNCPSDNVRIQTIQHALWVPVKVCSSTAVFFMDLSLTIDDLLDLQSVTFILQNVVVNLF